MPVPGPTPTSGKAQLAVATGGLSTVIDRGLVPEGKMPLSPVCLLDESEDVADALAGIRGGDVVAVALQNNEPRIANELLVLPRLLDRLHFASVGRHDQRRGLDTLQDAVSRQV